MRPIIVFVAGQCPQKIKFYLLSGGGQSEAGVVVGQKSLVVVRLLGFLDTTTDSRNIGLERLVLGHSRFLPVINYCLPHDSSLIDGDASPDESLDVERHRELDWLLQVHHNSVPARFHLRSIFFLNLCCEKVREGERKLYFPSGYFVI